MHSDVKHVFCVKLRQMSRWPHVRPSRECSTHTSCGGPVGLGAGTPTVLVRTEVVISVAVVVAVAVAVEIAVLVTVAVPLVARVVVAVVVAVAVAVEIAVEILILVAVAVAVAVAVTVAVMAGWLGFPSSWWRSLYVAPANRPMKMDATSKKTRTRIRSTFESAVRGSCVTCAIRSPRERFGAPFDEPWSKGALSDGQVSAWTGYFCRENSHLRRLVAGGVCRRPWRRFVARYTCSSRWWLW
jgi:hypothetical protein